MAFVNFVLGAKGGVGKTFIAASLAQFINSVRPDRPAFCYDADPNCASLTKFKGLKTKYLDGVFQHGEVKKEKFDPFVEAIIAKTTKPDDYFILDSGGNTYSQLVAYLIDTGILEFIAERTNTPHSIIHIPISGGQEMEICLNNFDEMCRLFANTPAKIVVWLNEFHGTTDINGKPFSDTELWKKHSKQISTLVKLPKFPSEFERTIAELFKAAQTFDEGAKDPKFPAMTQQRIVMAKRQIFQLISGSQICEPSFFAE